MEQKSFTPGRAVSETLELLSYSLYRPENVMNASIDASNVLFDTSHRFARRECTITHENSTTL